MNSIHRSRSRKKMRIHKLNFKHRIEVGYNATDQLVS